ncbi:hypothetical protein [uncultured Marinobacter sp.]|uniref:hypothetical protein n=1 Tax=uncultured Marinobacter sp. TaxID=187379 RepID=UPI002593E7DE|nr:hypothetical protein [uncultured Marinobacter sp.]
MLSVTRGAEQHAAAAISAAKIIELNEILASSAEEDTSGIVALQQRVGAMIHDLTNAQSANDAMDDANKELNARVLVLTDTCSAQDARAVHTNEHFKSNMAYADSLCTELATANRVLKTTSESLSRSKAELEKWKHESVLRDDDFVDQELFYQVCDQAQVVSDEVKVLKAQLAETESSAYEVHDLRNEVLRMNCIILKLQETIVPIADLDASNRAVASDAPYMHLTLLTQRERIFRCSSHRQLPLTSRSGVRP